MLSQIAGLHHVTSMAADAQANNAFFTRQLGLRRVKKTVNFDEPSVYHLYYGDETGSAGTIMTYFPFPDIGKGRRGAGEVGETQFSVPAGSLGYWRRRFEADGVAGLAEAEIFGEKRLSFRDPDGDDFALVEVRDDARQPYGAGPVPADVGVHGFRGVTMRLRKEEGTAELLKFMGYREAGREGTRLRLQLEGGNGADVVEIETVPGAEFARPGAGSVHHVAFSVADRAAQLEVRKALLDTGYQVTPVIDRDYFWAIYFRTPGGVLFEIATMEPGFARDEPVAHLGESLRIPAQHAHLRERIERILPPLEA